MCLNFKASAFDQVANRSVTAYREHILNSAQGVTMITLTERCSIKVFDDGHHLSPRVPFDPQLRTKRDFGNCAQRRHGKLLVMTENKFLILVRCIGRCYPTRRRAFGGMQNKVGTDP